MNRSKTAIDWLRFRAQGEVKTGLQAIVPLFGAHADLINLKSLERGSDGFQQACELRLADVPIGRVDYGGPSQRGWVRWNVNGKGCGYVEDWDAIEEIEALPESQARRMDVCLTTFKGEVTHEIVVRAHGDGLFTTRGRPPELRQITSSNPRAGQTCYVGQRKDSEKFGRFYEKGFEIASKLGVYGDTMTHVDEHRIEDIYRSEIEFKATDSKPIPWEVVERRDQYFGGAYPFCAQLLPGVEADILQRRPERDSQRSLIARLAEIRSQYGSSIFTALTCYGGDIGRLMEQICGDKHSLSLLEAGVLLVEHE